MMTKAEMTALEIAGLREGLEIAREEANTSNLACREFVRMQHELCQLLGCDGNMDSLALHDRIVAGIRRLQGQPT